MNPTSIIPQFLTCFLLYENSSNFFVYKKRRPCKHEAPHDKGEGKSLLLWIPFLNKRSLDSLYYLYTNPRYNLIFSYLCTRPDPSPPANFITSSIDTKLKSPSIECFKQEAATAISIVS